MELLLELPDAGTTVSFPLRCSQRIKYTCFDVSKNLLIFGATSGGLYVFNREPCTFIQLIPNAEGSIVKIKISPDEKSVSFATHKGNVCVCDCGKEIGSYIKSSILNISKEHRGNEITYMIWNDACTELYIGDDTGTISVLRISKSFTKNVFQTMTNILMMLDSRIVQIDKNSNLLLVSTLTRCFICDISNENYAQIGKKLRDGEFGACFFNQLDEDHATSSNTNKTNSSYSILGYDKESKSNLQIFCARPGSRIWEVNVDATVICTHQFKEPLSKSPTKMFNSTKENIDSLKTHNEPQSLNFPLLYMFNNEYIFTFRKDGIFILDPKTTSVVLWSNKYKDIIDSKVINNYIYLWRLNGNLTILSYFTIETFLIKCYYDQDYKQCAQICDKYADLLLNHIPTFKKIHILSDLGEKLTESGDVELLEKITHILEEINKNKKTITQKSGIYTVENSFIVNSTNEEVIEDKIPESALFQISPLIKHFSFTLTDKLSSGLKKTWDHLEDKMKKIKLDKTYSVPLDVRNVVDVNTNDNPQTNGNNIDTENHTPTNGNIISSEDSNSDDDKKIFNNIENNTICNGDQNSITDVTPVDEKIIQLYDLIKNYEIDIKILSFLSNVSCDINSIFHIIRELENYIILCGHSNEYSTNKCAKIFLLYIENSSNINDTINVVIKDDNLSSYFLESFININSNWVCVYNCECGYPIPSTNTGNIPIFIDSLNIYIEKKWELSQTKECYDICKKVPYMWKKILLLRKGEDMKNILILLLQMLDEELLHMYLPHFTYDIWEKTVKLFATLKKCQCLNCGKIFNDINEFNLFENINLDWDTIGALMIRSIRSNNTISVLKNNSDIIPNDGLSLKFYHSCFFAELFQKYDSTVTNQLIETIYQSYAYNEAIVEMCKHLSECIQGTLPHTALPFTVASKSTHWGLKTRQEHKNKQCYKVGMSFEETLPYIEEICPNKDCFHCCVSLTSKVLFMNGGLWAFSCGHTFHGACLNVLKIKLCPLCSKLGKQ